LQGNTTYKVYLVATDTSGATKVSSALTITTLTPADVQSPTVNISSMTVTPGTLMENGTINVLVPISDNVGVSSVTARIVRNPNSISIPNVSGLSSGNLNLTRSLGTTLSGTWSGSSSMNFNYGSSDGYLIPGIYDIVVSASDVAGNNTTVTKTSAFVLGSQAGGPVIASTDIVPVSGSVTPGSSVKISTRVVAYNQTISSVQISSDGSNLNLTKSLSFVSGTSSDGIFETTITIPNNMNSGTYSFRIIANTANGRTNESTSNISVTYQNGSAITSSIGGSAYYFSGTGHFYQYVSGYRTFENAKFVAQGATAGGKRGYLVTITSGSENSFIQNNIGMSSAWIGASDAASEGCWRWINGTASDMAAPFFAAPNAANCGASAGFTSWMSGEPNDFNGNEDHALILPVGIWNDFTDGAQNLNAPLGFIIEYGD
jgi:hypothetical protein